MFGTFAYATEDCFGVNFSFRVGDLPRYNWKIASDTPLRIWQSEMAITVALELYSHRCAHLACMRPWLYFFHLLRNHKSFAPLNQLYTTELPNSQKFCHLRKQSADWKIHIEVSNIFEFAATAYPCLLESSDGHGRTSWQPPMGRLHRFI